MRTQQFIATLLAAALAVGLAGCSKEQPAVASPTCANLDKVTDPAQRAELLKNCPRSGPEFKPSPKKDY